MNKFLVDGRYGDILALYGIRLEEVLRKAKLPGDTFRHKTVTMTEENYYRFIESIGSFVPDHDTAIKLATTSRIEAFSPPVFAAYCSKNGEICLDRLAHYKRLIGPMTMQIIRNQEETTVVFTTLTKAYELPAFLVETEFAFLVGLIRKTTHETINPVRVRMKQPISSNVFTDFFNIQAEQANENSLTFRNSDLLIPFISYDDAMWDYFEPELTKRLSDLDVDDSTSARVRSALTELLPGGYFGIDEVAEKLGLSRRTLQRKLNEENTTFLKQLNSTREMLALHYIRNTDMSTNDIAFLLGYQELNSFHRAFTIWTGKTISDYRKNIS